VPWLDASDILLDPDLAEWIEIRRRAETVTDKGRATMRLEPYRAPAVIFNEQSDLISNPDERHTPSVIAVHTRFRLRGTAPGYQGDLLKWAGAWYLVTKVNDNSRYGRGFIMATCAAIAAQDAPPE